MPKFNVEIPFAGTHSITNSYDNIGEAAIVLVTAFKIGVDAVLVLLDIPKDSLNEVRARLLNAVPKTGSFAGSTNDVAHIVCGADDGGGL